jgi:hypothetical protein
MEQERLLRTLSLFFPGSFANGNLKNPDAGQIIGRLLTLEDHPIDVTHFNQLLHLVHEAGCTPGFFRYYFLVPPESHSYPVRNVTEHLPVLNEHGISSLEQLEWGLRRFYTDALIPLCQ